MRLHDVSNVGSNVGSKRLSQYGVNVVTNVGGAGCQLYDALNSPTLEANIKVRLHDASNVGSNVGSEHLGQYGANAGANVVGAGCRLHDASNSPILEANIRQ